MFYIWLFQFLSNCFCFNFAFIGCNLGKKHLLFSMLNAQKMVVKINALTSEVISSFFKLKQINFSLFSEDLFFNFKMSQLCNKNISHLPTTITLSLSQVQQQRFQCLMSVGWSYGIAIVLQIFHLRFQSFNIKTTESYMRKIIHVLCLVNQKKVVTSILYVTTQSIRTFYLIG